MGDVTVQFSIKEILSWRDNYRGPGPTNGWHYRPPIVIKTQKLRKNCWESCPWAVIAIGQAGPGRTKPGPAWPTGVLVKPGL